MKEKLIARELNSLKDTIKMSRLRKNDEDTCFSHREFLKYFLVDRL